MTLEEAARAYYALIAALSARAQKRASAIWAELDRQDVTGSWDRIARDSLFTEVATAQKMAATAASRYMGAALDAQDADWLGPLLNPDSLAGVASDGRDLDDLLFQPAVSYMRRIKDFVEPDEAFAMSGRDLETIVGTQVSDIGRAAMDVEDGAQPAVTGYVRMLTPPACGRCAILAGRFYRWSSGFARHPNCDCVHIPATEDAPNDLRTDPDAYFESLTSAEQNRYFGKASAEAIRQGANMNQVVNARRGASGLSQPGRLTDAEQQAVRGGKRARLQRTDVFGRQVFTTTEGTTVRGIAGKRLGAQDGFERRPGERLRRAKTPRLMPEAILELADGDKDEAARLFKRFGYIL